MEIINVWKNRREEDIQECLEEVYRKLGYKVINNHRADRRNENGIDMEVSSPSESIYIQTKIKPVKKDKDQLAKLASSKSDKKLYIYADDPSGDFKEEMGKTTNVEFWDYVQLNKFLLSENSILYLRLVFLSSDLIRNLISILKIISSTKSSGKDIETEELKDWWVFKDRAVKLHGSLELIYLHYTSALLSHDLSDPKIILKYFNEIFEYLFIINSESCSDLLYIIRKLNEKYPFLIAAFSKRASERSNWLRFPFNEDADNPNLNGWIESWIIQKPGEGEGSFYSLANYFLKNLSEVGDAIEDGVDWVFEDKFGHSQMD